MKHFKISKTMNMKDKSKTKRLIILNISLLLCNASNCLACYLDLPDQDDMHISIGPRKADNYQLSL